MFLQVFAQEIWDFDPVFAHFQVSSIVLTVCMCRFSPKRSLGQFVWTNIIPKVYYVYNRRKYTQLGQQILERKDFLFESFSVELHFFSFDETQTKSSLYNKTIELAEQLIWWWVSQTWLVSLIKTYNRQYGLTLFSFHLYYLLSLWRFISSIPKLFVYIVYWVNLHHGIHINKTTKIFITAIVYHLSIVCITW